MPVLNEDTFALLALVEQNEALYDDCFRIASLALERHPIQGPRSFGIAAIAADARTELAELLRNVILYCDDQHVQQHIDEAKINWPDVARELIADVLAKHEN